MLRFISKSDTLRQLEGVLQHAFVLPQLSVGIRACDVNSLWRDVVNKGWDKSALILRSSGGAEDTLVTSNAGKFASVGNIVGETDFRSACARVLASFADQPHPDDRIFVQPMLSDVACSGVAFSLDPSTEAPYILINFDDTSGRTDTVTSGSSNDVKTFYVSRSTINEADIPETLAPIVLLLQELEGLFACSHLDIEFAIDRSGKLYLLQVRPLALKESVLRAVQEAQGTQKQNLDFIARKLRSGMARHPHICGDTTVFGVMPDWNPAEMIGIRPKPLALSLYKEIITDNIWAYQRNNYGYRNLRSFPLMVDFLGLPYIDVRVSFNSFVPASLNEKLAEKLVNYYISRLKKFPNYHDKVEFEIILSCYSFDLPEKLQELKENGFNDAELTELQSALRTLTNQIIHGQTGLWKADLDKAKRLETRRQEILHSDLSDADKIYWLLEDCKRYGTLPFAGLARAGFIAVQILKSLVSKGIFSHQDYEQFLAQLECVSSNLSVDFATLSRETFLEKYGHLRPGTYDILSPRYDAAPDLYFEWSRRDANAARKAPQFSLSLEQFRKVEALLQEHGFDHNVLGLFEFIQRAIEAREMGKFIFTRSLSDSLETIARLGATHGFSREECAFIDIQVIKQHYSSSGDLGELLRDNIAQGKKLFQRSAKLMLPPLITSPRDAWAFTLPSFEPNFITNLSVCAPVVAVENDASADLAGMIAFISSADPGYDWIFSRNIRGFVTMYGGVNSHMAIRAVELGIPAVIGTGEMLYQRLVKSNKIEMDCLNRQIRVIQ